MDKKNFKKWIANGRPKNKVGGYDQSNVVDISVALFTISNKVYKIETNSMDWWIDNGAMKHVTNRPNMFIEFREFKTPCDIRTAKEETLKALGQGTIQVLLTVNDKIQKLTLNDV